MHPFLPQNKPFLTILIHCWRPTVHSDNQGPTIFLLTPYIVYNTQYNILVWLLGWVFYPKKILVWLLGCGVFSQNILGCLLVWNFLSYKILVWLLGCFHFPIKYCFGYWVFSLQRKYWYCYCVVVYLHIKYCFVYCIVLYCIVLYCKLVNNISPRYNLFGSIGDLFQLGRTCL